MKMRFAIIVCIGLGVFCGGCMTTKTEISNQEENLDFFVFLPTTYENAWIWVNNALPPLCGDGWQPDCVDTLAEQVPSSNIVSIGEGWQPKTTCVREPTPSFVDTDGVGWHLCEASLNPQLHRIPRRTTETNRQDHHWELYTAATVWDPSINEPYAIPAFDEAGLRCVYSKLDKMSGIEAMDACASHSQPYLKTIIYEPGSEPGSPAWDCWPNVPCP